MSDFGHVAINNGDAHMDIWGAGPFIIEFCGRTYRFEDSDRFGPVPLTKDLQDIKHPGFFAESNPFWYAWQKWKDQGRRLAPDGITCWWDHES